MTDEEVYDLLFPDRGPVIEGVKYRAGFWGNGSIGHLVPVDSDERCHGTVRWWDKGGSFERDVTWVHGERK